MSLCAACGLRLSGDAALCPHHHCVYGDDWAVANRIMCDFFHRKKIPPVVREEETIDEYLERVDQENARTREMAGPPRHVRSRRR